jgi:tripartite-type tricarboxylate transporter receptor subunit TctC
MTVSTTSRLHAHILTRVQKPSGGIMSILARVFTALIGMLVAAGASAQDYPKQAVKLVVAYAPGGTPDVIARTIAQRLSQTMGQPFVVENKPGAGGIPANQAVATAKPDGYTLLVADIGQLAITPYLFKSIPYEQKDFAPVSLVALTPLFIAVNPSVPINNLQDLVAQAKAKPGSLTYGSAGIGSIHHISMESLKHDLGVDITHVPYKGSGQSVPAFMGGDVQMIASAWPALHPAVTSGKAKVIAVTSLKRYSAQPNVPAVSETVKGYDFSSEVGVLAPAGTPPAIIHKLAAEIQKICKEPDTIKRFETLGSEAVGTTPEAYAENLKRNYDKYAKAVKVSGARPE